MIFYLALHFIYRRKFVTFEASILIYDLIHFTMLRLQQKPPCRGFAYLWVHGKRFDSITVHTTSCSV